MTRPLTDAELEQNRAQEEAEAKRLAALKQESDAIEARQKEGGRSDMFDPGSLGVPKGVEVPWVPDTRESADAAQSQADPAAMGQPAVEAEWTADDRGTSAPEAPPVAANPKPASPHVEKAWVADDRDKHPGWANRK